MDEHQMDDCRTSH